MKQSKYSTLKERVIGDLNAAPSRKVAPGVYMPAHQTHAVLAPWAVGVLLDGMVDGLTKVSVPKKLKGQP